MRWIPSSETELAEAFSDGRLVEGHHLDLKREVPAGARANKSLAIDLASLAVDGGVLLYGVDENAGLQPFNLSGFRERVDQVARSLIDEPLAVTVREIPAESRERVGYVVVVVPESPAAPHMVDGRYRGRGDTTNIVLSDAEVLRLHQDRVGMTAEIDALIEAEVARDPLPHGEQGHIFVVAQPLSRRDDMLLQAMAGETASSWITANIVRSGPASQRIFPEWSPDMTDSPDVRRRASGWSIGRSSITDSRRLENPAHEGYALDIELHESGGIRLYCGRATDVLDSDERVVLDAVINGLLMRTLLLATSVSRLSNHLGSWQLGIKVTGLRDCSSYFMRRSFSGYGPAFSEEEFSSSCLATVAELEEDPRLVSERLIGRLNRALNGGQLVATPDSLNV